MVASRVWIVLCCASLWACDKKAPPAPPVVDPLPPETINGTERIGWDQRAADSAEVAAIRYAIYTDNARAELANVSCAPAAAAGVFACAARLPALTPGPHTLELASFVVDGSLLESARSTALRVVVSPGLTQASRPLGTAAAGHDAAVTLADGPALRLDVVADAVEYPVDIAFASDGRIFVAERDGRVRILLGRSSAASDVLVAHERLLALALDPQFERTHFVYAISVASRAGQPTFSVARFREASNTFGDRVVLLDGIRARANDASAALRFGPDGALYAAFDDAGVSTAAGDLASANGKILRLNPDGSTPGDQAGANPVYAFGFQSPRGITWRHGSDGLWIAERRGTVATVEAHESSTDRKKRGVMGRQFALPGPTEPSAIAFSGSDLLVASDTGRRLLRVRFNPQTTAIVGTEELLRDRIGPIRIVGVGPEGAIYVGTDHDIARLILR